AARSGPPAGPAFALRSAPAPAPPPVPAPAAALPVAGTAPPPPPRSPPSRQTPVAPPAPGPRRAPRWGSIAGSALGDWHSGVARALREIPAPPALPAAAGRSPARSIPPPAAAAPRLSRLPPAAGAPDCPAVAVRA